MRGAVLFLVLASVLLPVGVRAGFPPPTGEGTGAAPADTTRRGPLLQELQRDDTDFYPPDIFEWNRDLADSGMAALDSLGLEEFERETIRHARRLRFDIDPAEHLLTYNRVEGPVSTCSPTTAWRGR